MDSNVIISVGTTTSPSTSIASEIPASLIQGTVKDDEGQVMPGVNIVVKGTTTGTTTDSERPLCDRRQARRCSRVFVYRI